MSGFYNVRLGISPINWINNDMDDLGDFYDVETMLTDMRKLGFSGTEMSRKFPEDPETLKRLLARHGLVLSGAWVTVQFSSGWEKEEDFARFQSHIQFLRSMGSEYAVVCDGGGSLHWDARGQRTRVRRHDDEAWRRLAVGLHRAGEYARKFGVRLAYHPHFGTAVESQEEIDRLMAMTDPELVSLLLDTGHIFAGGGDPVKAIRKHGHRIHCVHLKDVRREVLEEVRKKKMVFLDAVRRGMFTTPGDGCIDFRPIFEALHDVGYQGWMVIEAEQDPRRADPVRYAKAAKEYVESLLDTTARQSM